MAAGTQAMAAKDLAGWATRGALPPPLPGNSRICRPLRGLVPVGTCQPRLKPGSISCRRLRRLNRARVADDSLAPGCEEIQNDRDCGREEAISGRGNVGRGFSPPPRCERTILVNRTDSPGGGLKPRPTFPPPPCHPHCHPEPQEWPQER